jgi:hypothetical protein
MGVRDFAADGKTNSTTLSNIGLTNLEIEPAVNVPGGIIRGTPEIS